MNVSFYQILLYIYPTRCTSSSSSSPLALQPAVGFGLLNNTSPFFRIYHRLLSITDSLGKPEGKRPLGRPRRRWEDNIKMDLQEVGGGGRGD